MIFLLAYLEMIKNIQRKPGQLSTVHNHTSDGKSPLLDVETKKNHNECNVWLPYSWRGQTLYLGMIDGQVIEIYSY